MLRSMESVHWRARTFLAAASVGLLVLTGCSATEWPSEPKSGVVSAKESPMVNGDCLFSHENVCMIYERVREYDVTVEACHMVAGEPQVADRKYLMDSSRYPSDYPLIGEGEATNPDGSKTSCSETYVVDQDLYNQLKVGEVVSTATLG